MDAAELKVGVKVVGVNDRPMIVRALTEVGRGAFNVTLRDLSTGQAEERLIFEDEIERWRVAEGSRTWSVGDGHLFRLVSEAYRIRLAWLFDPRLAVHTSRIEPLPHQIAAVYEDMLPRQPLRFLLADDPGAGKTIMAGLLLSELRLRGDVQRCLVVVPANLGEQWQDEMDEKFGLRFDLIDRNTFDMGSGRNLLNERDMWVGRIDLLKRKDFQEHLMSSEDWDLVIVDEAHKMSARYAGDEAQYTARYRLGETLRSKTRHFLLMTATPHSGKEDDFQLFLRLLDDARFEGRARETSRTADVSDMLRRVLKEELTDFEGEKLFPDRVATTLQYEIGGAEKELYEAVTAYVREEMNRADRLQAQEGGRGRNVVGFALTVLQRRLASSPAAIHGSLKRRRSRLQTKLDAARDARRRVQQTQEELDTKELDALGLGAEAADDLEQDFDEALEDEVDEIVDLATAARTIADLEREVSLLGELEEKAGEILETGRDRKWQELQPVIGLRPDRPGRTADEKLVVFTEHKETLYYLVDRIGSHVGRDAVVAIHGTMKREDRREAQNRFLNDPEVAILVATDAAGEGVNLQRAHLMVNCDLPWNPNRIEQRFGRIHRFGQKEVCHLWNLVASNTREGAVYQRLLEKLEVERRALGGKVYDVLGRALAELDLRSLMLEAIRDVDSGDVQSSAERKVEQRWDPERLRQLMEDAALHKTTISQAKVRHLAEQMERYQAQRLVPHFIESFFLDALRTLGGRIVAREKGRYEIRKVPDVVRERGRSYGYGRLPARYERVCFDKSRIDVAGTNAELVVPGHALLSSVVSLVEERYGDRLREGCVLVDPLNRMDSIRVMLAIETTVFDGQNAIAEKWVDYIEIDEHGDVRGAGAAPYLDYRSPTEEEIEEVEKSSLMANLEELAKYEESAVEVAVRDYVHRRYQTARADREAYVEKAEQMVSQRLDTEIRYWRQRAREISLQRGDVRALRVNAANATQRADTLQVRRDARLRELHEERSLRMEMPRVTGACVVVPVSLFGGNAQDSEELVANRRRIERVAMKAAMEHERDLGRDPQDVSDQNWGWDVESRDHQGHLRLIEVKGRAVGEKKVTLTRNEYLTSANQPEHYRLVVVIVDGEDPVSLSSYQVPHGKAMESAVADVSFKLAELRPADD